MGYTYNARDNNVFAFHHTEHRKEVDDIVDEYRTIIEELIREDMEIYQRKLNEKGTGGVIEKLSEIKTRKSDNKMEGALSLKRYPCTYFLF